MKTNTIVKEAAKDAERWAAAEMFFGEGAGTRRKLLEPEIARKVERMSGYHEAFEAAYDNLDMTKFAEQAIKERKKIDSMAKANKNFRALKSGNLRGLSNGVFIVAGVAYVAHTTGYDKVAMAEGKKLYKKAKAELKFRKARFEGRNVEKIDGFL